MSASNQPSSTPVVRLGFGCGSLGSDLGYRASCALIEGVYDCGFRHFDVAPPYGNGLAERILGEVLGPVRDSVTVVTKAGIRHPRAAAGLRLVRRVFLPVKEKFPGLWKQASNSAHRVAAPRGRFDPNELMHSVQESLHRLRTDHVDVLLLHEAQATDLSDELLGAVESIQSRGWARAIGIGTSVPNSVRIVEEHPRTFAWVQTNHYWAAFLPQLRCGTHRLVTHGCVRNGRDVVASTVFRDAVGFDDATQDLRSALSDPERAAELLVAAALMQNADGLVLVWTSKLDRARRIARLGRDPAALACARQLNDRLARIVPAAFATHP
jgi:hypothetical protein